MPRWNVHFDVTVDNSSVELRTLIATIHAVAGLTREMALPPMVDTRLNALNILRAVRGTTGIEGAQFTEEEVGAILDNPRKTVLPAHRKREEQEARNANEVMEYVRKTAETAISEPLISTIHNLTTQRIDYKNNIPGKYRSHPTNAGDYLPPETNQEIRALMARFVEWINAGERVNWDPIIRAVLSNYLRIASV